MNILVGCVCKKSNKVYIAADRRMVINGDIITLGEESYPIKKTKEGILVGITGDINASQLVMSYKDDLFTLNKKGELTSKHIGQEIIPSLVKLLGSAKMLNTDDGQFETFVRILLGYKDNLFVIDDMCLLSKHKGYVAIGKYAPMAAAILYNVNLDDEENIKRTLIKSLKVCSENTKQVGGSYILANTDNDEIEIMED